MDAVRTKLSEIQKQYDEITAKLMEDAVKSFPKIVEFGELDLGNTKAESAATRIEKYKAEQEAKGRELTFAEAAEECFKQ